MVGLNQQFRIPWKTHAEDSWMAEKVARKRPRIIAHDADGVWDLVKSFTNGMEIAEGYEFSLMEDHDLLGDALDFIEDVAAHQDRPQLARAELQRMRRGVRRARGRAAAAQG